jgi:hypothetical protein
MKLKTQKSGSPRPFETWYFVSGNRTGTPDRIGHASSRLGAVRAAVTKLRTSESFTIGHTAAFALVEIYDELGMLCNMLERRKDVVAINGYY